MCLIFHFLFQQSKISRLKRYTGPGASIWPEASSLTGPRRLIYSNPAELDRLWPAFSAAAGVAVFAIRPARSGQHFVPVAGDEYCSIQVPLVGTQSLAHAFSAFVY